MVTVTGYGQRQDLRMYHPGNRWFQSFRGLPPLVRHVHDGVSAHYSHIRVVANPV